MYSTVLSPQQLELPRLSSRSFVMHGSSPLAASSPPLINHIPVDAVQVVSTH